MYAPVGAKFALHANPRFVWRHRCCWRHMRLGRGPTSKEQCSPKQRWMAPGVQSLGWQPPGRGHSVAFALRTKAQTMRPNSKQPFPTCLSSPCTHCLLRRQPPNGAFVCAVHERRWAAFNCRQRGHWRRFNIPGLNDSIDAPTKPAQVKHARFAGPIIIRRLGSRQRQSWSPTGRNIFRGVPFLFFGVFDAFFPSWHSPKETCPFVFRRLWPLGQKLRGRLGQPCSRLAASEADAGVGSR